MPILVQILATIIVCFPCLNMGIISTLPSSTLENFVSINTTLERPMTDAEVNWFGSLAWAGNLVGAPVVAGLMDRLGRRHCSMLVGMASVTGWAILAFTNKVEGVITAVFVGGISGTSFLIVPVFCGEFCQESIRGTVTAGSMAFCGVGVLVSYLLGGYLEYKTMVYVALAMALVELALMFWLKESPTVLMMKGHEEEAADSLAFYRQVDVNSKVVVQELASIRRALNPEVNYVNDLVPEMGKLAPVDETKAMITVETTIMYVPAKLSMWQHLKNSAPARRGSLITLGMMSAAMFQGIPTIQVYAGPLFAVTAPGLSPTACTLALAVAIVVPSLVAACVSDLAGRRPLMIYSSLSGGVFCLLIGLQIQLDFAPTWVSALLLYLFAIVFNCGGGTIPFVLLSEMFLPEVKCFMTMIVILWMSLCYFLNLVTFYPLVSLLGLGGVFQFYSTICFASAAFAMVYVPETKGLTLETVQLMLVERRNFPS